MPVWPKACRGELDPRGAHQRDDARGPRYHQALHDVTTGNNTVQFPSTTITGHQAAPGWDPVTGWGSPDAQVLIPLLARYAMP
jgi:hypothetical protein